MYLKSPSELMSWEIPVEGILRASLGLRVGLIYNI